MVTGEVGAIGDEDMRDAIMDFMKRVFSTPKDLIDARLGASRVADAENAVRETMAILEARKETLRLERQREQS